MLHKLRQRAQDEKGFTLIELLVVILIIGILAAIALPAFLGQRAKGQDTEAKTAARTAQTAMETHYSDTQDYTTGNEAALEAIEPALKDAFDAAPSGLGLTVTGNATGYVIDATSKGNNHRHFIITSANGEVTRTCTGTGCKTADASGNQW
jgi:type IV pilus assembly protein PilA